MSEEFLNKLEQAGLSASEKLMVVFLKSHRKSISLRKLSKVMGFTCRNVQRILRTLKASGLVTVISDFNGDGGRAANRYEVHI